MASAVTELQALVEKWHNPDPRDLRAMPVTAVTEEMEARWAANRMLLGVAQALLEVASRVEHIEMMLEER